MDPLTACKIKNECRVLLNRDNNDRFDLFKDVRKQIWDLVREESVPIEEINAEMVVNILLERYPENTYKPQASVGKPS